MNVNAVNWLSGSLIVKVKSSKHPILFLSEWLTIQTTIQSNDALTTFSGLQSVEQVGGDLMIEVGPYSILLAVKCILPYFIFSLFLAEQSFVGQFESQFPCCYQWQF